MGTREPHTGGAEKPGGRFLYVFCDESRQTKDRYMVLGGIILTRNVEPAMLAEIAGFRQQSKMFAELKWTKVSNQKYAEYCGFVDLFFQRCRYLHFRAIVIDTHEINNRRYNRSDKQLGFYKLMYQFLLHQFGRYLEADDRCIIYLDQRNTGRYKLSTLHAVLNNGLHKKHPYLCEPVRSIEPMDSHDHDLIQMADVLMGAIGYEMNGMHLRDGAKQSKVMLARYIANKAGLSDLQHQTPRSLRHFGIWHFHFRK